MPVRANTQMLFSMTAEGNESVVAALREIADATTRTGRSARRSSRGANELGRSFRNILLRTTAIIGVYRTFNLLTRGIETSIRTGLEYSSTIESATLAIASLISAQGTLTDANGRQLEGVEELNVAYDLAVGQVRALRIAGIQTAATTQELVDAYQQAVGAGLSAGLTLDEVRKVTIRIAQAAGALGVPYRQLNEEIRSILSGITDQNTRIAKALHLRNEELKLAREQGRLAEFLLEKFEAFGTAGERITGTWAALKSNLQEAFELFAGDSTRPLFDALRREGQLALRQIFDLDTAEISQDIEGIVNASQTFFDALGNRLSLTIRGAVAAARDLSGWLEENEDTVRVIVDQTFDFVGSLRSAVGATARAAAHMADLANEGGLAAQSMETIGDALDLIANNRVLAGGAAITGLVGFLALVQAIAGPGAAAVLAITAAITVYTGKVDALVDSQAELEERTRRSNQAFIAEVESMGRATARAARLANEYRSVAEEAKDTERSVDDRRQAERRLLEIENELLKIAPEYTSVLEDAKAGHESVAEAIRQETYARRDALAIQIGHLNTLIAANERAQQELAANAVVPDVTPSTPFGVGFRVAASVIGTSLSTRLQKMREEGEELNIELTELLELFNEIQRVLALGEFDLTGPDGADPDAASKAAQAQARIRNAQIKAELDEFVAITKAALENNEISYNEYYDRILYAQLQAIEQQIQVQEMLKGTAKDATEVAQAEARIIALRGQADVLFVQNEAARTQALERLRKGEAELEARILNLTGQVAEAARIKATEQYREMLRQYEAESNEAGVRSIQKLINVEVAKAQLEALEQEIQSAQNRLRERLAEIQGLQEVGAIFEPEAQALTTAAYRELQSVMAKLIPMMEAFARATQDPKSIESVEQLKAKFAENALTIRSLTDEWGKFRRDAFEGTTQALENFFTTGINNAESFGDAFRSLAADVVASIQRILARIAALKIATAIFGGQLPVGGAKDGGLVEPEGFAAGGRVRGPGGPRDDRVLARLSAGEFVMQAAAVRRYGVGMMEQLNQGLVPRAVLSSSDLVPRFASGGLVEPSQLPVRSQADFRGQLEVGLRDGLVLDHMDSPDGDRLVVRIVERNIRRFRKLLGR